MSAGGADPVSAWDDELQLRLGEELGGLWRDVAPGPDGDDLRAVLTDAVDGGKRVRPRLVAEVHDSLGGRRAEAVLRAAAAVELLHTAFVVHDDLIDGDGVRRGRPSVPGRFRAAATGVGATPRGAQSYAVAGALLTGDLALSAALAAVTRLGDRVAGRVLDLVVKALTTSAAGELADVRFSLGGTWPSAEEALDLAYRKTAAYSFVLPMQVGALLADADDDLVQLVGEAGRCLGIAFQLYDDLAGMFDDAASTGKDPLADLREGKLTLLVCHARGTRAWPRLHRSWGDLDVTPDDLVDVRQALEESGSRAYVEAVAAEHVRAGLAQAERAGVGTPAADWVATLLGRSTEAAA